MCNVKLSSPMPSGKPRFSGRCSETDPVNNAVVEDTKHFTRIEHSKGFAIEQKPRSYTVVIDFTRSYKYSDAYNADINFFVTSINVGDITEVSKEDKECVSGVIQQVVQDISMKQPRRKDFDFRAIVPDSTPTDIITQLLNAGFSVNKVWDAWDDFIPVSIFLIEDNPFYCKLALAGDTSVFKEVPFKTLSDPKSLIEVSKYLEGVIFDEMLKDPYYRLSPLFDAPGNMMIPFPPRLRMVADGLFNEDF